MQDKNSFVYAYPRKLGKLTSIKYEGSSFELITGFKEEDGTLSVVAIDGIDYYVYRTDQSTNTYTYILQF